MTRPLVYGHRGAPRAATENTRAAFAAALAEGADGIELDVRRCATGEIVVYHDADLRRLAGRPGRPEELPLAALREVRLAGGERIPLLEEVLAELPRDRRVNVELKAIGAAPWPLARSVARLLAAAALGDRVLVSSFHPMALALFRLAAPRVATGMLFGPEQTRPIREAWARPLVRPRAVHPHADLVDARRVARWHAAGHEVNVWTVDDPKEARRLADLGVDALITNVPGAIRAALTG